MTEVSICSLAPAPALGTKLHAFKRLSAGYSDAERRLLFAGTAARVYRLDVPDLL